jgi:hypothetical protein
VALVACTGAPSPTGRHRAPEPAPEPDAAVALAQASADALAAEPAGEIVVAVTDSEALGAVAAAGGRFADLVSSAAFAPVATRLAADIADTGRGDPRAGVGIRGHAHRLFDAGWLRRERLELVAVINRIDLMKQTPGACGDVRLVYRLGYRSDEGVGAVASRLPMTAVAILDGPEASGGDCRAAAARWRAPAGATGAALGAWLVSDRGPLGGGAMAPARARRLLTNLQAVRWPSTVHPSLGGHAEYLLREHTRDDDDRFAAAALLAVPDVERIRGDRRLRAQLLAWLRDPETAVAADRGAVQLPASLRAQVSRAVTPRGFSRRANRPFRSLIDPAELAGLELAERELVTTPSALLVRLDELTCAGCHQARSVAGFHLLGEDPAEVAPGNALAIATSPHLIADLERRKTIAAALAAGERPALSPPFAQRAPRDPGASGSRCGLGDPAFAAWTCATGLRCIGPDVPGDDPGIGVCAGAETSQVGEACELGAVVPHRDPRRDRILAASERPCAAGLDCIPSKQGFPGGLCAAAGCESSSPGSVCGVIAGAGFDACLIAGRPFPRCIAESLSEMTMRGCSEAAPCRDDYICARTPAGGGACVPPYFLFQLRVDGHPPASK